MKKQSAVEKKTEKKEKKDSKEKVSCPECSKVLTRGYLNTHITNIHGEADKKASILDAVTEIMKDVVYIPEVTPPRSGSIVSFDDWEFLEDSEQEELMVKLFGDMTIDSPIPSSGPKPKRRDQEEKRVQAKLEKRTGYTHMPCKHGIIDLFSEEDKIIIEIKRWPLYKHALGQLQGYAKCYPTYQLQAHLFGKIPPKDILTERVALFSEHRIQVTWDPDPL